MMNRREILIVSLTVGVLALVATPLLWVVVVLSHAIDLRMDTPFAGSQFLMAFLFAAWLLVGTVIALTGAWAAHRAGLGKGVESAKAAVPEVAAPQARASGAKRAAQEKRPAVGAVPGPSAS